MSEIDVFNVILAQYLRIEMDAVTVDAVTHTEGFEHDVIVVDGRFYRAGAQSQRLQLVQVGDAQKFRTHRTAIIHHRRLRQLLNALGNDIAHQFGQ